MAADCQIQSNWPSLQWKEHVCEEADDDVVLVKDRRGQVIGFERLNFLSPKQQKDEVMIPIEVQMV
ncbi:MAG: hypothetical protein A2V70_10905 [Planctomycetes bacterium RBG_13_63_9]|nr:MAG: hypothetical protein A2V70_10905 [Planctomycetes bacterium RBG_13_63_9]